MAMQHLFFSVTWPIVNCKFYSSETFAECFLSSSSFFHHRFGNSHFKSSQLGQSSQTAQTGIAGIRFLVQVIYHLMAVVRTHRYGCLTALLH